MDPTRITAFELSKTEVVLRVKAIAQTEMKENLAWEWVLEPYSRDNRPPDVRTCCITEYIFWLNFSGMILTGVTLIDTLSFSELQMAEG
jgi:hypothetical protein